MTPTFPDRPNAPRSLPDSILSIKGGLLFNSVILLKGQLVEQHVHSKPHPTFIGSGAARLWADRAWGGDFKAGEAVEVAAGVAHVFEALEDNTLVACVWEEKVGEEMLREADHAV